jgi:hypothetical protein
MKKPVFVTAVLLFMYSVIGISSADEISDVGVSPTGEHGLMRLTMPMSSYKHLSISGHGGYGFTETMGPVSGAHHRILGSFAIAGAPLEILSMKLLLRGYHDRHPNDDDGKDNTTAGVPQFGVRLGNRIGKLVLLGGSLDLLVPGDNAPSLSFEAAILEPKLLFALAPSESKWRLLFNVGYRWDNSYKTAPEAA